MASNSLSFEEFITQRASGGDQTFFNCAVKKADKVKQVERKLDGKKRKKIRNEQVQVCSLSNMAVISEMLFI